MDEVRRQVARALLEIDAVIFTPHEPITFKSGLRSPVYVDNRCIPFWPSQWRVVLDGFRQVIEVQGIDVDVIAGIEAGGIPHSAALGYILGKPSVFVRKATKEHGTRSRVEGGDVSGRRVLLVEDLVTTGGSSLAAVQALREAGAVLQDCLAIVSYGFAQAAEAFAAADVRFFSLTSFDAILREARRLGSVEQSTLDTVEDWLRDPYGWVERQGR